MEAIPNTATTADGPDLEALRELVLPTSREVIPAHLPKKSVFVIGHVDHGKTTLAAAITMALARRRDGQVTP